MTTTKFFPKSLSVAVTSSNKSSHYIEFRFISLLQQLLNFKLVKIESADQQLGLLKDDGNWTGVIGMLQREEADIGLGKLFITPERSSAVDFSYPTLYGTVTFATDKPKYISSSYAVLYPFSFYVWIAVIISLIIVFLVSYFSVRPKCGFQSMLLTIYGIFLEHSMKMKFSKLGTKLLLSFWIVGTMFITFAYKAVLLSFLTFPTLTGIRDVSELSKAAESDSIKCSTYKGSLIYSVLQHSKDESWNKIAECMTRSDMFLVTTTDFIPPTSYKKAFISLKSNLGRMKTNYYISDDHFYTALIAIAVRKSFCCKDRLDELIHKVSAAGIFNKFLEEEAFFFSLPYTSAKVEAQESERKITLKDLSVAFVLLIFGYIISFISFILEITSAKRNH